MSIENSLERIATALESLASDADTHTQLKLGAPAEAVSAAAPAKRGPGRPPKATVAPPSTEAAASAEPASVTPTQQAPAAPAPTTTGHTAATKEQTQNALVALIKANKRDTVVKILGEHGAQSVSALAPEHYAAVYAKAIAATPAA